MKHVSAYLTFDGNCRQAMSFYEQRLGAELRLTPVLDTEGKPSADPAAPIMHSQLMRGPEALLMACDNQLGGHLTQGDNFSVAIQCDSLEEIESIFTSLSQNGQVSLPLGEFSGARFGMLTDQFGIQWMLHYQDGQQS